MKEEKEGQHMKAVSVLDAKEWARETFGEVELGDPRRGDRVVQVAAAMAENPAASLPTQMGDRSTLQAAHRLFINEAISFEQLQDPHWQQTQFRKPESASRCYWCKTRPISTTLTGSQAKVSLPI